MDVVTFENPEPKERNYDFPHDLVLERIPLTEVRVEPVQSETSEQEV